MPDEARKGDWPAGDRVALITGAGGDLGGPIAARLAADGYAVALGCSPNQASIDTATARAAAITRNTGRPVLVCPTDIADPDAVDAMARQVRSELGPIGALVCNAATSVAAQQSWRSLTAGDWSKVLAVNVTGSFLCVQACYEQLLAAGDGSVVLMSSVTPLLGRTGNLHYVTSKAALIGMTRSLAREVGADGVRVNAIAPGAIESPSEAVYGNPAELADMLAGLQSLPRRGRADDIGDAVSFLLGPRSGFVTGQLLVVDGGWVMH